MSVDNSKNKKPSDIDLPKGEEAVSDIPDGVSEDVYRFWKENGTRILIYCAVALIVFFGVQGWKQFSVSHEASLREQFAQLDTTEAQLEFAGKHSSHGLAAYAYLQAAKESYEADSYAEAADYYGKAAAGLKDSELLAIALMGEASSLKEAGDASAAVVILEKIISNQTFAEGIRAEAMFKRIAIALNNGEDDVAENYTAELEAIDDTQIWAQRLESIQNYQ